MKKTLMILAMVIAVNADAQERAGKPTREQIVAVTLLAEARGGGFIAMLNVACVIQQRAINRNLEPYQICLQRRQFSCWNKKTYENLAELLCTRHAPSAKSLALDLQRGVNLGREKRGHPDHYFAKSMKVWPRWAYAGGNRANPKLKPVHDDGHHLFFRLRRGKK